MYKHSKENTVFRWAVGMFNGMAYIAWHSGPGRINHTGAMLLFPPGPG